MNIAPHPARMLAAIVDYAVITAVGSLIVFPSLSFDYSFIPVLIIGAIYYTVGNSATFCGQTLGKRVFGLRVARCNPHGKDCYASITQSFVRYCASFGALIIVAEIPEIIFRGLKLQGSPALLEIHLLAVLAYFFANICWILFDNRHRALHDIAAGTIVLRTPQQLKSKLSDMACNVQSASNSAPGLLHSPALRLTLSTTIATILWLIGILQPPLVNSLKARRFELESLFPLRIQSITVLDKSLMLHALALPTGDVVNQEEQVAFKHSLINNVSRYLLENHLVEREKIAHLEFNLLLWKNGKIIREKNMPQAILFDTNTLDDITEPKTTAERIAP